VAKDWTQYPNLYLHLFADCIAVRGAAKSAFCDLTRHEIITFPSDYYPVLEELLSDRLGVLLEKINSNPNKERILGFLDFLDENELVMLVEDKSAFPPLDEAWDFPGQVQNAVVDVSTVLHDFQKIFDELSALGCQHLQIRCFSNLLTLSNCGPILEKAANKSILSFDLILKYEDGMPDEAYVKFVEDRPMIAGLAVHSAPLARRVVVDYAHPEFGDTAPLKEIRFTAQVIDSEIHCGLITQKYLTRPSVATFFEARSFNGCLNRKISIDAGGNIKNCPSMKDSYGNVRETSLSGALHSAGFKDKWGIAKDQISICRDCEFRYVCSDCRAYLEQPDDAFSKPLKCGYDPYTGTWDEWTRNPMKKKAVEFYGMERLLQKPVEAARPASGD
jgi:SPASM domain peptide maturase of grasp-with-spasm system